MFLAIGAAALGLFFGPVGMALGRRLAGQADTPAQTDLEEMGAHVTTEMDELRRRLAEVEERLDFAERLLTDSPPANQLPRGAER
jgi:hypothetical protein